ncbi:hypothetical protein HDF26_005212 [Pedobacter cryoconitis]|uniref:hypothetical protein n=1 Tax=Pedobacter cryoconitis TaxID=188932 RepID=UPI0016097CAF|nr:hypothetical protein [Pedobacter cryoconitis]MBB6274730.1 hypothetical protein [Pedobacter cryoconitis]
MAKQTLNVIKNWFKTGLKPSQLQFWDTWDSFWHKDEIIPAANIENLDKRFDEKADQQAFAGHLKDVSAHGINNKVDKEAGKGLSANDYTDIEKQKLARLYNFDDTDMQEQIDVINQKNTAQDVEIEVVKDLALTINSKENIIAIGTKNQYFRGDKTWQTLDKTAIGLGNLPTYLSNYGALKAGLSLGDFYSITDVFGNYMLAVASVETSPPLILTLNIPSDNYKLDLGTEIYSYNGMENILDYGDGYSQKSNNIGVVFEHTYLKAGIYKIALILADYSNVMVAYIRESAITKMENLSKLNSLTFLSITSGNLGYFNTELPSNLSRFYLGGIENKDKNNEIITGIDIDIFRKNTESYFDLEISYTALADINFKVGFPGSLKSANFSYNKSLTHIDLDIFKNCTNLTKIELNDNGNLFVVKSVSSLPKGLKELHLQGNKLTYVTVNNILIDLDKIEFTALTVTLNNQNQPAVPTGDGLIAKNNLIAKGFSIITD